MKPRLLNPTFCKYERIDEGSTVFDPIRREATNFVKRKRVIDRLGQFVWISSEAGSKLEIDPSGRHERQTARVVHLVEDFEAISEELRVNDKLIEVGGMELSLYVWRVDFTSHYEGKFTLMEVSLKDRRSR